MSDEKTLTPEKVIRARLKRLYGMEDICAFFEKLIMMIVVLVIMFGYVFGIAAMNSNDMAPKLAAGDLMLYYRLEGEYSSDDVVVFKKNGRQYTGRVVARGGDSVEITDSAELMINGSSIVEDDIFYQTQKYDGGISYPVELGEDEYFILCDYREGAKDSRYFGAVSASEIKGKVMAVVRRADL